MNAIRILARTDDTVTLSIADFEALVEAREDAIDNAAIDAAEARERDMGKEAARARYLPADAVDRLLDGEHPVRVWREHRGLSQKALAGEAGMVPSYLNEIERGLKPGGADAIRRLAGALGVAMEDLMPRQGKGG